jgi:hypothetical protein
MAKANGYGGNISRKRIHYITKGGSEVLLQSSYEETVAKELDLNNITWVRPNGLPWKDDSLRGHTYYADFYLPEYGVYLDPKSDYLIEKINPRFGMKDSEKIRRVELENKVKIFILNKDNLTWDKIQILLGN